METAIPLLDTTLKSSQVDRGVEDHIRCPEWEGIQTLGSTNGHGFDGTRPPSEFVPMDLVHI